MDIEPTISEVMSRDDTPSVLAELQSVRESGEVDTSTHTPVADNRQEPTQAQAQAASDAGATPTDQVTPSGEPLYEIVVRGEKKTLPLSKILTLAQQGEDYSTRNYQLKLEKAKFEQERQSVAQKDKLVNELQQKLARFEEVDSYIKENPSWWDHVQSQFNQARADQGQPASPIINQLKQEFAAELQNVKSQLESVLEERKLETTVKEDMELDNEIRSFRESHADLDWNGMDESGLNLEQRILKRATELGIPKYTPGLFQMVARDMLFDSLIKRHEIKAKEQVGKEIKKTTRAGIGPVTDKPTVKMEKARSVRAKSWDDLTNEALNELGIA